MSDEEKEAEMRAKESSCRFKEEIVTEIKSSETPDKTSVNSDPLNTGKRTIYKALTFFKILLC